MKKLFLTVLCLCLVLSLCACESGKETEPSPETEGFEYIETMNDIVDFAQSETQGFENYTDKYEDALGDMGIYLD